MQIADNKKITITFRIEPGCLGPEGASHVDRFCQQAQQKLQAIFPAFINWQVVPRHDKTLPELDYGVTGRPLTRDQAGRYLSVFEQDIDQFEEHVFDELPELIDQYFGR